MGKKLISIVIPAYNEASNVGPFYDELVKTLIDNYEYEFIFINDGSNDATAEEITRLHDRDKRIRLINFSRNFGKELATTAGIHKAQGEAIIIIDADGQHPPELITEFLNLWQKGNQVVVGVRKTNKNEGFTKKYGSKFFYALFNRVTKVGLTPGSTDFRLIDKVVQQAFTNLTEANRITRGLIDWLGFQRTEIKFDARPRLRGEAAYSTRKLFKLALNSFVSLSFTPLHIFGYLGLFITATSFSLGSFVIVEQYIMEDPLGLKVTGSASVGILVLFLVGILLISQWLTSLYISRMYEETKNRPLYIIDTSRSILE